MKIPSSKRFLMCKELAGTSKDTEKKTFILAESVLGLVMTTGGQTLDFVSLLKESTSTNAVLSSFTPLQQHLKGKHTSY